MLILNADESMFVLITKGWRVKNVPRKKDMSNMEYIERICRHWTGLPDEYPVDVWGIYSSIFEKVLTPTDILRALNYCAPDQLYPMSITRALIGALAVKSVLSDNGDKLIQFDTSEMIKYIPKKIGA